MQRAAPRSGRSTRVASRVCLVVLAGASLSVPGECAAVPFAPVDSISVGGTVALDSQLVDRGIAITEPGPILQGALHVSTPSGWSAGLSTSVQSRSPGGVVGVIGQIARSWVLSGNWQMQSSLSYYRYPGHGQARTYDRSELGVSWIYRDVLTLGVSGTHLDRYGGQRPRGAADLGLRWPLAHGFAASASLGVAQELLPPRGNGYERRNHYYYGHLGMSWDHGPWRVELAHMVSHRDRLYFQPDISPWIATVSWTF